MLKAIFVSATLVAGTAAFSFDAAAAVHHHKRVLANGRCNGTSYGTGARRCGTATGGPVGGNSSRN